MTTGAQPDEPDTEQLVALGRLLGDPSAWAEPSDDVEDRIIAAIGAESTGVDPTASIPAGGDPAGWAPPTTPPSEVTPTPGTPSPQASTASGSIPALAEVPPVTGPRRPDDAPRHPDHPPTASGPTGDGPVADLDRERRTRRGGRLLLALGAAAALLVVAIGAIAVLDLGGSDAPVGSDVELVALAGTELAPEASALARVDDRPNGTQIVLDIEGLDPAPDGFFYSVWVISDEPRTVIGAGSFHLRGGDGEIEFWAGVSPDEYPTITVTLETEADPAAQGELLLRGRIGE